MQELNNIYLYYYQNKDNIKSGSISLYYLLGKGRNELHNKIDIEIIQNPLIDTVHRVTTGIIQNHFLHILGTQHTKTKLPFIIEEITFHDYYGIRNN